jgi:hypothetical protein
MKNSYEIRGDTVAIFIHSKGEVLECLIDLKDFDKVNSYPNTWCAIKSPLTGSHYVVGKVQGKNKRENIYIHRLIKKNHGKRVIDHRNHDSLDNRRKNLRYATYSQNTQNKKTNIGRGVSGCRNVSLNQGKWAVSCQINKKMYYFGRYDELGEATVAANRMRKFYMPFSN